MRRSGAPDAGATEGHAPGAQRDLQQSHTRGRPLLVSVKRARRGIPKQGRQQWSEAGAHAHE
eukprot:5247851-Pleurochrysis_carterae.AAC.1